MKKATREKIERLLEMHPERNNSEIRSGLSRPDRRIVSAAEVGTIREELGIEPGTRQYKPKPKRQTEPRPEPPNDEEMDACGISLRGVRISAQKPAMSEGVKKKIYELKKGMGHPLEMLSIKWQVSEDTIRKHAKRCDAFRYVERGPGDWVACVVHPDSLGKDD